MTETALDGGLLSGNQLDLTSSLTDHAIAYAKRGFKVFPLQPGDEIPATTNGHKDASNDQIVALQRWSNTPNANIGLVTDEIIAVDVDGEDAKRSLLAITGATDLLELTPLVQVTPRGGWHLIFRRGGYLIRTSASQVAPNIDVRGVNREGEPSGYIVVAPSVRADGKQYRWLQPSALDDVDALPLMPKKLAYLATFSKSERAIINADAKLQSKLKNCRPDQWVTTFEEHNEQKFGSSSSGEMSVPLAHPYLQTIVERFVHEIESAPHGCQESTLNGNAFKLGANLKRFGCAEDKDEAIGILIAAGTKMLNESGKKPWSKRDIASKVRKGLEDGLTKGRLPEKQLLGSQSITSTGNSELDAEIDRLARLHPLLYDKERKASAKALDARVETLDKLVEARREAFKTTAKDGFVNEDDVWPHPVDGGQLLLDLVALIRRHVVLPPGAAEAIALWILHSHAHDAAVHSPILGFNSPDMRCGKTTVSKVVCALVPNGLHTVNITPSVLFRVIEAHKPTLVIDEGDSFFKLDEGLRNLLNGGHDRESAYVYRTEGEGKDREPAKFSVWAPKVFAQIGPLPETIEDRSIRVPLKRKLAKETAERLPAQIRKEFSSLRRRAARWSADNMAALTGVDPAISSQLNDRAADNWRPLFAIADLIGGEWPERARKIAMTLSEVAEDDGNRASLLADIRQLFLDKRAGSFKSTDLVHYLNLLETAAWGELRADKGMSTQMLGRKLRDFGIQAHRRADGNYYDRQAFKEAFDRYLGGNNSDFEDGANVPPLEPLFPNQEPETCKPEVPAAPEPGRRRGSFHG